MGPARRGRPGAPRSLCSRPSSCAVFRRQLIFPVVTEPRGSGQTPGNTGRWRGRALHPASPRRCSRPSSSSWPPLRPRRARHLRRSVRWRWTRADACAASASAFHDALEHRRAKLHARYGDGGGSLPGQNPPRYLRFGDFPDAPAAARRLSRRRADPAGDGSAFSIGSVGVGDGTPAAASPSSPSRDPVWMNTSRGSRGPRPTRTSRRYPRTSGGCASPNGSGSAWKASSTPFDATTPERLRPNDSDERSTKSNINDEITKGGFVGDDPAAAFAARVCVEGQAIRRRRSETRRVDSLGRRGRRGRSPRRRTTPPRSIVGPGLRSTTSNGRRRRRAVRDARGGGGTEDVGAANPHKGSARCAESDASLGLQPSEMSAARSCASLAEGPRSPWQGQRPRTG